MTADMDTVVTMVAGAPRVMNKLARYCMVKEVGGERCLLVIAPGHGWVGPPVIPVRLDASWMANALTLLLADHQTDSQAPKSGLERQLDRLLRELEGEEDKEL